MPMTAHNSLKRFLTRSGGGVDEFYDPSILVFLFQHPVSLLVIISFASLLGSAAIGLLLYDKRHSARTVGTVYDVSPIVTTTTDMNITTSQPSSVISFEYRVEKPSGQLYSAKAETKLTYRIGDKVDLKYNVHDPNRVDLMLIDYTRIAKVTVFLCIMLIIVHCSWLYLVRQHDLF